MRRRWIKTYKLQDFKGQLMNLSQWATVCKMLRKKKKPYKLKGFAQS